MNPVEYVQNLELPPPKPRGMKPMKPFLDWLTQQSTIKAIIVLAGVAGLAIDPDYLNQILMAVGVLYGGVAAFLDKS